MSSSSTLLRCCLATGCGCRTLSGTRRCGSSASGRRTSPSTCATGPFTMDERAKDLADLARAVLSSSAYMTLATADANGRPWASPVWFAWDGRRTFWWVSMPDAVHSQNIDARSDVAIVVFDTGAPVGQATAVYVRANARRDDDAGGLETFSRKSVASGLRT